MKILNLNLNLFIAFTLILTSCLTAKKVDKQVAKQYGEITQPRNKKSTENIFITSPLITPDNKISVSETRTSHFLPLIVYYQWEYKNTCTLNPRIPVNNFIQTVQTVAGKGLTDKISGQKLELGVDKIPTAFAIDDKAHLVFFGYAFGWDNVSIVSDKADMVVTYKLSREGAVTKQGTITIPYTFDTKKLGMFKSWKKATAEYLDQYNFKITEMSKLFVQQLLTQI